jgi:hypothetical protein
MQFVLGLADKVSAPAKKAAGSMSMAAQQAKVLQSAMTGLEKAAVKASALGDTDKLKKLHGQWNAMDGALRKVKPALDSETASATAAAEQAASLEAATGLVTGGLTILAGAALAVGAALVDLTIKGAEFAIETSEWKAQLTSTFEAMGEVEGSGRRMFGVVDQLSRELPQGRQELGQWALKLQAMGVSAAAIPDKLRAMASAQALTAAAGGGGAEAFEKLQKKVATFVETGKGLKLPLKSLGSLYDVGLRVDDVAKKMGVSTKTLAAQLKAGTADAKKFGDAMQEALIEKGKGPLEQMGLTTGALKQKMLDNVARMFEDVNPEPFLKALREMGSVLDSAQPSGKALKWIVTTLFDDLFSVAAKVLPYIQLGFLKLIEVGLELYIQMKPAIRSIEDLFGHVGTSGAAITSITVMAATVKALLQPLVWAVQFVGMLASAVQTLADAFGKAEKLGKAFSDGLSGGIVGGGKSVIDAATNLADSAKNSVKSALGIHSPSLVMQEMGEQTGAGFAMGMSASNDNVYAAGKGLAMSGAGGTGDGGGSQSISNSSQVHIDVGGIHIGSAGSAEEAMKLTEEAFASALERVALQGGLLPNQAA